MLEESDEIRLLAPGDEERVTASAAGEGNGVKQEEVNDARRLSRLFGFPYEVAYSIQLDLMRALFTTIEEGKIGIFESPTGTGKSLSLLCAACTWLARNEKRHEYGVLRRGNSEKQRSTVVSEPDWVQQHELRRKREEVQRREEELKKRIQRAKEKREKQQRDFAQRKEAKRMRLQRDQNNTDSIESDDEFAIDHEHGSGRQDPMPGSDDPASYLSPEVKRLMEQSGSFLRSSSEGHAKRPFYFRQNGQDEDDEPETMPKIVFASRTHSQLTQFVGELKRTVYGGAQSATQDLKDAITIRTVSIGSRKQMCINPAVIALSERAGVEAMNERCLELMRRTSTASSSSKAKCEYLPSNDEAGQEKMLDFRDNALSDVRDIEEVVQLGRDMHICPYFGARQSAKQAHLITLPYNLLLNSASLDSLGIDIRGSIIIIDEAHNLIDTILATHSLALSDSQVQRTIVYAQAYLDRFAMRLKGTNEVNMKTFLHMLRSLDHFCADWQRNPKKSENGVLTTGELIKRLDGNADQVNLMELGRWLRQTKVARKIAGYADKLQSKEGRENGEPVHSTRNGAVNAIHTIEGFLLSLSNRDLDGKVYVTMKDSPISASNSSPSVVLKYQLLNPSEVFRPIVDQARTVVLAGGTMEPVSDFTHQLFPQCSSAKLTHFSCPHIIPPSNMLAAIVCKGIKGTPLEFTFDARSNPKLLEELTGLLTNYSMVIPHGVVVFVPSYGFLDSLQNYWQKNGTLARLSAKKQIFSEPKEAKDVEKVLQAYHQAIDSASASSSHTGALLLAVVGAKLSEGINFSDRLARAVIMVGMPFANSKHPELVERMKYVRHLTPKTETKQTDAGQELYVNLCMKAVNQSIGRAIRHQNDYAALIFLDARYARTDIQDRLPQWIRRSTSVYESFGPSMAALGSFFREKKGRG